MNRLATIILMCMMSTATVNAGDATPKASKAGDGAVKPSSKVVIYSGTPCACPLWMEEETPEGGEYVYYALEYVNTCYEDPQQVAVVGVYPTPQECDDCIDGLVPSLIPIPAGTEVEKGVGACSATPYHGMKAKVKRDFQHQFPTVGTRIHSNLIRTQVIRFPDKNRATETHYALMFTYRIDIGLLGGKTSRTKVIHFAYEMEPVESVDIEFDNVAITNKRDFQYVISDGNMTRILVHMFNPNYDQEKNAQP